MGQRENSNRQANLDEEKERGKGRQNDRTPERAAIKDAMDPVPAKGKTGGAFGAEGKAERKGMAASSQGAGGGGNAAVGVGRESPECRREHAPREEAVACKERNGVSPKGKRPPDTAACRGRPVRRADRG